MLYRCAASCLLFSLSAAAITQAQFAQTLYPIFEKAACRGCHTANGVASATRLHFPDSSATPKQVELFGRSLVALVDRAQADQSLLLNKPTNRTKHVGGERIVPGSPDEVALRTWVHRLAKMTGNDLTDLSMVDRVE